MFVGFASFAALLLAASTSALPVYDNYGLAQHVDKRLVISPAILAPTNGSVWVAGSQVTVAWSTKLVDEYNWGNHTGEVVLGKSL